MKRPSRGLRESVATMLKKGRFLAPPRASRMTTIGNPLLVQLFAENEGARCRSPDPNNPVRIRRPCADHGLALCAEIWLVPAAAENLQLYPCVEGPGKLIDPPRRFGRDPPTIILRCRHFLPHH